VAAGNSVACFLNMVYNGMLTRGLPAVPPDLWGGEIV
jgi:hypothetical protein